MVGAIAAMQRKGTSNVKLSGRGTHWHFPCRAALPPVRLRPRRVMTAAAAAHGRTH